MNIDSKQCAARHPQTIPSACNLLTDCQVCTDNLVNHRCQCGVRAQQRARPPNDVHDRTMRELERRATRNTSEQRPGLVFYGYCPLVPISQRVSTGSYHVAESILPCKPRTSQEGKSRLFLSIWEPPKESAPAVERDPTRRISSRHASSSETCMLPNRHTVDPRWCNIRHAKEFSCCYDFSPNCVYLYVSALFLMLRRYFLMLLHPFTSLQRSSRRTMGSIVEHPARRRCFPKTLSMVFLLILFAYNFLWHCPHRLWMIYGGQSLSNQEQHIHSYTGDDSVALVVAGGKSEDTPWIKDFSSHWQRYSYATEDHDGGNTTSESEANLK